MKFGSVKFKSSQLGIKIGGLLSDGTQVAAMKDLSQRGIPAVQALGKPILAFGMAVSVSDKQMIGRWVREVMEENGWTTDNNRKGCVAVGNLFSTGAIYVPKKPQN